jgi:hypothetical protein
MSQNSPSRINIPNNGLSARIIASGGFPMPTLNQSLLDVRSTALLGSVPTVAPLGLISWQSSSPFTMTLEITGRGGFGNSLQPAIVVVEHFEPTRGAVVQTSFLIGGRNRNFDQITFLTGSDGAGIGQTKIAIFPLRTGAAGALDVLGGIPNLPDDVVRSIPLLARLNTLMGGLAAGSDATNTLSVNPAYDVRVSDQQEYRESVGPRAYSPNAIARNKVYKS